MVDFDGKPTTWGRWNPEYVNARPKMVGDRKINSSNIIAMLQTAYHFTGKGKYKEKALDLMENHQYLDNLMRPMEEISVAPDDADDWSKMLSESWNHSDDEMYFLGYWGLYKYAFNDTLKAKYKEEVFTFQVRTKTIEIKTHSTSLSQLEIPKVSMPRYESWADILRWNLQKGVVTIPKSVKQERIIGNSDIFDFQISTEDIAYLDSLDRNERIGPDPDNFNF